MSFLVRMSVAPVLIVAAIGIQDYDILRWFIFIMVGILIILDKHEKQVPEQIIWVNLAILILFNPIIPIYLYDRPFWIFLDIVSTILVLFPVFRSKPRSMAEEYLSIPTDSARKEYVMGRNADHIFYGAETDDVLEELYNEYIQPPIGVEEIKSDDLKSTLQKYAKDVIHLSGGGCKLIKCGWFIPSGDVLKAWNTIDHTADTTIGVGWVSATKQTDVLELHFFAYRNYKGQSNAINNDELLQAIEIDLKRNGISHIEVRFARLLDVDMEPVPLESITYIYEKQYRLKSKRESTTKQPSLDEIIAVAKTNSITLVKSL